MHSAAPSNLSNELRIKDEATLESGIQMTFGGSAPVSPVPQLTPTSVEDDSKEMIGLSDEDEAEELEGLAREEQPQEKTAAERRAEKRKMKRFR